MSVNRALRNQCKAAFFAASFLLAGCSQLPVLESDSQTAPADEQIETTAGEMPIKDPQKLLLPDPLAADSAKPAKEAIVKAVEASVTANKTASTDNLHNAITQWQTVQQNFPKWTGSFLNEALLRFRLDEFDTAKALALQAIDLNANNYYAWNLLGVIAREQGHFGDAQSMYQKALAAYPAYQPAHLNLAILADLYLGDLQLARQHYNEFQKLAEYEDEQVKIWLLELNQRLQASGAQP